MGVHRGRPTAPDLPLRGTHKTLAHSSHPWLWPPGHRDVPFHTDSLTDTRGLFLLDSGWHEVWALQPAVDSPTDRFGCALFRKPS